MKGKLLTLGLACSLLFLGSCSKIDKNKEIEISSSVHLSKKQMEEKEALKIRKPREQRIDMFNKEGYEVIPMQFMMVQEFITIGELEKESDLIIEGTVERNEYIYYMSEWFTISDVKIGNVLKEDANSSIPVGETIRVLQTGGIGTQQDVGGDEKIFTTPEDKQEFEENRGKIYEFTNQNIPVLKETARCILFLEKYDGPMGDDLYVGVGDYQGRFIVESDNYIEPQSEKIENINGNKDFTMSELKKEIAQSN